ncbi:fascin domain-containing protein [Pleionea sediminis]|uniref:fascin domain-containing protein n=1 Tax=Pleionea sediminis TaxID=2569479 RepID=UPI00118533E1|nr:hypothetical protein [Pleionea sediminis]
MLKQVSIKKCNRYIFCFLFLILSPILHASSYEVSFKSVHNRYFVNEGNGGSDKTVNANRSAIGNWEKMFLIPRHDGCIRNGSRVSVRSGNQFYWRSPGDGRLHVDRTSVGINEVFTLINHSHPGRCITNNDWISLRSAQNKFVVAESDGNANANRGRIGSWEKIRLKIHKAPVLSPAPDSGAESRKAEFREIIANNMFVQAVNGDDVPMSVLENKIELLLTRETGDFRLAELVRLLYLSGDKYDDVLLPVLRELDYWLVRDEELYARWSENHMILWISSAYLMRQREGWAMREDLNQRLNHFLDLKLQYGFYEFFSSTYHPFTLGALLNLADFAEDPLIKAKATAAAKRMMKELLLVFNDRGAFYPAAGRNYPSRYISSREYPLFWIITGKGNVPNGTDYVGGYLATSDINLDDVAATYKSRVNITLRQGHNQNQKTDVHYGLSRLERTIFQWSSGAYFHPDTASDTAYTVDYYNFEDRKEFKDLARVAFLPDSWMNNISQIGAAFSRGSNLSKATIDIFKNKNIVLTSLDNYYPGYKGYQQWPWAATIEDVAVFAQTGDVAPNFDKKSGSQISQNSHFPKVQQSGNVALITYFPLFEIRNGTGDKGVNLFWPTERFDEHQEIYGHRNGNWLVARKNNSYIAVLRAGTGIRSDGHPRNWGDKGRQMWAVVVGNKEMYGSYQAFKNKISQANISESFRWDWRRFRMVYRTRIDVDGKSIGNTW